LHHFLPFLDDARVSSQPSLHSFLCHPLGCWFEKMSNRPSDLASLLEPASAEDIQAHGTANRLNKPPFGTIQPPAIVTENTRELIRTLSQTTPAQLSPAQVAIMLRDTSHPSQAFDQFARLALESGHYNSIETISGPDFVEALWHDAGVVQVGLNATFRMTEVVADAPCLKTTDKPPVTQ
jgi:hypothetical protein